MNKLRALLKLLIDETPLPGVYRDHPLKGAWKDYREAHLGPELQLVRTGRMPICSKTEAGVKSAASLTTALPLAS